MSVQLDAAALAPHRLHRLLAAPLSTALLSTALLLLTAPASRYRLEAPKVVAGVEIAPYAIHEECVALVAGERIAYLLHEQRAASPSTFIFTTAMR